MKIALIAVTIIIVLSVALLFILGKYSQKGQAVGLVNGSLSRCPEKPNCVCSEYTDDNSHYIEPVSDVENAARQTMEKAASAIQEMNGKIQHTKEHYISATFTSSFFGFVDDLEIRFDTDQGIMHIRSASRVGYGDGGVNRKRVEEFRQLYRKNIQ